MGTVSVSLPADGSTADVGDYNTPINTLVTEINGNLDNNNIKAAAGIDGSKMADRTVTATKIDFATFNTASTTGSQTEYTPGNLVGFSSTTLNKGYYYVVGKLVFITYYISGTSNSGGLEFNLPSGLPSKANNALAVESLTSLIINNGVAIPQGYRAYTDPVSNASKVIVQYSFTASGTKAVRGQFFYETT